MRKDPCICPRFAAAFAFLAVILEGDLLLRFVLSLVSPSSLPSRSVVSRRHPERSEGPLYLSLLLPLLKRRHSERSSESPYFSRRESHAPQARERRPLSKKGGTRNN